MRADGGGVPADGAGGGGGWAALAATGAALTVALVGYLWFVGVDQRGRPPAAVAGSFGVGFDTATDPARVSVVDDVTLGISDLGEDTVTIDVALRLRHRAGQAPQQAGRAERAPTDSGAVLLEVPRQATVGGLGTRTSTDPAIDAWTGPPARRPGVTSADVTFPAELAGLLPERPTPAGELDGRGLTLLPAWPATDGGAPGRFLRVPLPATPWSSTVISARYEAPAGLLRRPDRLGEQAVAVELDGGARRPASSTPDTRPVSDYIAGRGTGDLRLELGYAVDLSGTRFESVPPPAALDRDVIIWTEDLAADGTLRVDGHLVDESTRYWRGQLDVLALLLIGAVLGVVVDRIRNPAGSVGAAAGGAGTGRSAAHPAAGP